MTQREIVNGKIESTMLGYEDHGILTAVLHVSGAAWGQGFGTYCFGSASKPVENAFGMEFIRRVLDVLEVDEWEKVKGQHCRIDRDNGKVYRLGHILKDKWFEPEVVARQYDETPKKRSA